MGADLEARMRGHLGGREAHNGRAVLPVITLGASEIGHCLLNSYQKRGKKKNRRSVRVLLRCHTFSPPLPPLPLRLIRSPFAFLLIHLFHHICSPRSYLPAPFLLPPLIGSPAALSSHQCFCRSFSPFHPLQPLESRFSIFLCLGSSEWFTHGKAASLSVILL